MGPGSGQDFRRQQGVSDAAQDDASWVVLRPSVISASGEAQGDLEVRVVINYIMIDSRFQSLVVLFPLNTFFVCWFFNRHTRIFFS